MNTAVFPKRTFHPRAFLFFTAVTLISGCGGWFIGGGTSRLKALTAPPFMPAENIPFVLWSGIYLLLGIAAYLVWNANDVDGGRVLRLYLLQLMAGAFWPLFFIRLGWRLLAFFWLLVLIALATLVLTGFRYIRRSAYRLALPYLLVLLFAAYLNFGYYLLNR